MYFTTMYFTTMYFTTMPLQNPYTTLMKICLLVFACWLSVAAAQLQASYKAIAPSTILELDLLNKTNAARAENGLPALQADETLALAARHHALEMVTLNYFSHQSPTPESATPPDRIARAGSPFVAVGENIAKMPPMTVASLASQTVDGWMNSPGHRANILQAAYTHVGFGIAQDAQGYTYVVQNFAVEPFTVRTVDVRQKSQASYLVVLDVTLPQPSTAVFAYGNAKSSPMQLNAGTNTVELSTTEANQIYIRGAVPAPEGGGYIAQDGGWLTLASGRYQADELSPKTYLQITNAKARIRSSSVNEITVVLDGATQKSLVVLVNDTYAPDAIISPGTVRVTLPSDAPSAKIAIGELLPQDQVNIAVQFSVENKQGKLFLVANPIR
jgi:uncharacterized protein YkwD